MIMSKFEGFVSLSSLERRSATRYYIFLIINVFLGSILTGAAFDQLNAFINQSANEYVTLTLLSNIVSSVFNYSTRVYAYLRELDCIRVSGNVCCKSQKLSVVLMGKECYFLCLKVCSWHVPSKVFQ
jgi:hypothetical protein